MDKLQLIKLVEEGSTHREIAQKMNCAQSTIRYWMNKYDLKSKNFKIGDKEFYSTDRFLNISRLGSNRDLSYIQSLYDSGLSWREVSKIGKISCATIYEKVRSNELKSRNLSDSIKLTAFKKPRKHSEETKNKISLARKKYLKENGENPWKYKSSVHSSIPCEKFKSFLKKRGIDFSEEYLPLIEKGRFFRIDIAFPDKKIGIEINGNQHYNPDFSLKPYYEERHNLIIEEGWILLEIPSKRCFSEASMEEIMKNIDFK